MADKLVLKVRRETLPGYAADEDPLSAAQIARVRKLAKRRLPKGRVIRTKALEAAARAAKR